MANMGLSLLLVSPARKARHSVRQRRQRPVSPHRWGPPVFGWAWSVGPPGWLIQAWSIASTNVVVGSPQSGLARPPLLLVAHSFHLQQNSGCFADKPMRLATRSWSVQRSVQLWPFRSHANAMSRFGLGLRLCWLIRPSVQIWWRCWGRRRILLFFVVRRSWLRRKLSERDLVKRHHSKHLQLAVLPNAK